MANKILKEVKGFEDAEDGGFNSGKLWKLKKKLAPKPTAMETTDGKLPTDDGDILEEAVKHYKAVFKKRDMIEGLESIEEQQEKLCQKRLKEASQQKSLPWKEVLSTA